MIYKNRDKIKKRCFFFSFDNFRNNCNKGWFIKIEAKIKRGISFSLLIILEIVVTRDDL